MSSDHDITQILLAWDQDPHAALEQLTPLVYSELRRLASSFLRRERAGHTLQPTALVHEAYMRLAGAQSIEWKNRGHFFAIAARAMRQVLVESARQYLSSKRGSGKKMQLSDEVVYSDATADEFLELNEAIEALRAWDERKCTVLEMKYFGGMEREEIAEAKGVSLATIKRDISIGEAFLRRHLSGAA